MVLNEFCTAQCSLCNHLKIALVIGKEKWKFPMALCKIEIPNEISYNYCEASSLTSRTKCWYVRSIKLEVVRFEPISWYLTFELFTSLKSRNYIISAKKDGRRHLHQGWFQQKYVNNFLTDRGCWGLGRGLESIQGKLHPPTLICSR